MGSLKEISWNTHGIRMLMKYDEFFWILSGIQKKGGFIMFYIVIPLYVPMFSYMYDNPWHSISNVVPFF